MSIQMLTYKQVAYIRWEVSRCCSPLTKLHGRHWTDRSIRHKGQTIRVIRIRMTSEILRNMQAARCALMGIKCKMYTSKSKWAPNGLVIQYVRTPCDTPVTATQMDEVRGVIIRG
jgi:hypothetical protein